MPEVGIQFLTGLTLQNASQKCSRVLVQGIVVLLFVEARKGVMKRLKGVEGPRVVGQQVTKERRPRPPGGSCSN